jgi:hypothetical protein
MRSASWLSEDPKGAVDSPNLYAFVGWGPHVFTDPMGRGKAKIFGRRLGKHALYKLTQQRLKKAGLSKLFQVHHIAPQVFEKEYGEFFKRIGFKIDTYRNFAILPTKLGKELGGKHAKRSGHQGGPLRSYGELMDQQVARVKELFEMNQLDEAGALEMLDLAQKDLKEKLLKGEVKIQKWDGGNPVLTGGAIALVVLSEGAAEAAAKEEFEARFEEAEKWVQEIKDEPDNFLQYFTAKHYLGSEGFGGGVSSVIDFFNVAQDAEDLGEMAYIYMYMTKEPPSEEEAALEIQKQQERLKTLPIIQ